jgi:hypothetical protein
MTPYPPGPPRGDACGLDKQERSRRRGADYRNARTASVSAECLRLLSWTRRIGIDDALVACASVKASDPLERRPDRVPCRPRTRARGYG